MRHKILTQIDELMEEHAPEVMKAINESKTRIRTCGFSVKMDCTGPAPVIKVNFVQPREAIRDFRIIEGDNPNQGNLGEGDPKGSLPVQAEKETKAARKRAKKEAEAQ